MEASRRVVGGQVFEADADLAGALGFCCHQIRQGQRECLLIAIRIGDIRVPTSLAMWP